MSLLKIERSTAEHSGKGVALFHPEFLEQQHLQPNDLVEIKTRYGRTTLARVGLSPADRDGKAVVRLDQYMRQGLKARLGDMAEARCCEAAAVERLVLAPLLDVSVITGVTDYLKQAFATMRLPASLNAILHAGFPG